ncbi:MAG: nicotinic acid mononucleotide adenylyltransferase, partial [Bacillota bacterium]|nr:nicotinic acid mononucleotide adenylyltransferase [Bacillota bacterium]
AIKAITSWYKIGDLMEKCRFIAATRPGFEYDRDYHLPPKYRERISPLQVTALAISSSEIRQKTGSGRSVKYLLPEDVEDYIKTHDLYNL